MPRSKPSQTDGLLLLPIERGAPLALALHDDGGQHLLLFLAAFHREVAFLYGDNLALRVYDEEGSEADVLLYLVHPVLLGQLPYWIRSQPDLHEVQLSLRHGSSLVLDLAGDVLRGHQGAVEGGELLQEWLQGVDTRLGSHSQSPGSRTSRLRTCSSWKRD